MEIGFEDDNIVFHPIGTVWRYTLKNICSEHSSKQEVYDMKTQTWDFLFVSDPLNIQHSVVVKEGMEDMVYPGGVGLEGSEGLRKAATLPHSTAYGHIWYYS